VGANVTSVVVTCTTASFAVGGTVTGLTGTGLVLQNNGGGDRPIAADGAFAFAAPVPSGQPYEVTVLTQPTAPKQSCTVAGGSGTIGSSAANVSVTCLSPSRFAYIANAAGDTVSVHTVDDATGQLRANGYALTGGGPSSVAVDPTVRFAYVANSGTGDVSAYTIDATTGALTDVGTAVAAGDAPQSVAVDPSGKFAYVANSGSDDV
jgi:6-phosphogluconolactonase (cycloisomerase 2 family)